MEAVVSEASEVAFRHLAAVFGQRFPKLCLLFWTIVAYWTEVVLELSTVIPGSLCFVLFCFFP